jgi:glycogen debranching enzyme
LPAIRMQIGMTRAHAALMTLVCLALISCAGLAQTSVTPASDVDALALNTTSVAPLRFVAAHGRRALISGYAAGGLEVWAYPFEILNDYRVSFRLTGTTTPIDGPTILRRITYNPDSITRVYLGPDFIVRETLFVPLNESGAILTYSVQAARPLAIDVHATPILDLMWPAGVGGQSTSWNSSLSAFILSEPSSGYSAVVGSPDIVAHDELGNRTTQGANGPSLGFTLRTSDSGTASVYIALNPAGAADPASLFQRLITQRQTFYKEYDQHVSDVMHSMITVITPDEQVNRAIAWSELALDQAWVCNRDLGCGLVAGYGPSRGARRPQYDWFFAGDGLIAADASATAGNVSQARDELEFILRYQDKKTGMIWHELSQSAGFLDWAGKYPYMYVHVDITFQFLSTLARYVETTGDAQFARDHWSAIVAAYHYCESLIDPATALPRIPSNKEGGDEQDRLSDDLGLSVSWVEATSAFQQLATLTGHANDGAEALAANQRARASIPNRYWDSQTSFWISGHVATGRAVPERRSSPSEAIPMDLFTAKQNQLLLHQLASASFQTDWGSRGVAAGSQGFDPTSYAKGSVSALGTADLANTFWSEHSSTQAFALWSSLLPWMSLDSLGHLHEVLAGDVYQPQEESVPEQTWSSAGFLAASIHGLLGLQVDGVKQTIIFAPRLPSIWHDLSVTHVPLSGAKISFTLHQNSSALDLIIDNPGASFLLNFSPILPLGAIVDRVEVNHRTFRAVVAQDLPDTVANLDCEIPHGATEVHMTLSGGLSVIPTDPQLLLGNPSRGIHIIDVQLAGDSLKITADIPVDRRATIDVSTDWTITNSTNARVDKIAPRIDRITFEAPSTTSVVDHTRRVEASFQLKR